MSRLANSSSFTILKDAANWHSMVCELCVLICCVYYSFTQYYNDSYLFSVTVLLTLCMLLYVSFIFVHGLFVLILYYIAVRFM